MVEAKAQINIKVDRETMEALQKLAASETRTVPNLILSWINEKLEARDD